MFNKFLIRKSTRHSGQPIKYVGKKYITVHDGNVRAGIEADVESLRITQRDTQRRKTQFNAGYFDHSTFVR